VNHVDLTKVSSEDAKIEIVDSKNQLETLIGKKVISFAYPYGSANCDIVQMVKNAGFTYGIGTITGPLALHEDMFNIRRIIIHPDTNLSRFKRKVTGHYLYRKNKDIPAFPIHKEQNGISSQSSAANG